MSESPFLYVGAPQNAADSAADVRSRSEAVDCIWCGEDLPTAIMVVFHDEPYHLHCWEASFAR